MKNSKLETQSDLKSILEAKNGPKKTILEAKRPILDAKMAFPHDIDYLLFLELQKRNAQGL